MSMLRELCRQLRLIGLLLLIRDRVNLNFKIFIVEVQGNKVVIDGRTGPSGNLRASRVVPSGARRIAPVAMVNRGRSYARGISVPKRAPSTTIVGGSRIVSGVHRPANIPVVSTNRLVPTTTTTGLRQSQYISGNRVVGGGLRSSSYYPKTGSTRVVNPVGLRKSAYNVRSTSSRVVGGLRKSSYHPVTTTSVSNNVLRKSGYSRQQPSSKWNMRKSNYSSKSRAGNLRKSYTTNSIRGDVSLRRSNYVNNAFDDQLLRKSGVSRSRVVTNYDVDRAVDRIINRTLYN